MYYEKVNDRQYGVFVDSKDPDLMPMRYMQGHINVYTRNGVTVSFQQFYSETNKPNDLRKIADFMDEIKQLTLNQE